VSLARILAAMAAVGYPFLVYGGLRVLEPRWLALALGGALLAREAGRARAGAASPLLLPLVLLGAVFGLAVVFNEGGFFLFVPVLVNAALLVSFAPTLVAGPSMVESLARRRYGEVPAEHLGYCRRVTAVWCLFFAANGGVIVWLAVRGPLEHWTLYTGLIAYGLMGALFAAETTYRAWRFRRYVGDVTDVLFRRLFPPPR
jgi:uncharacterized membrane protein